MRIVIDTNILVSGFIWQGATNQLLRHIIKSDIQIYTSKVLFEEFRAVLEYPKIAKSIHKQGIDPEAILENFANRCRWCYPVAFAQPVCRDPDDDAILACALASAAELIISGDDDLLVLKAFENISIVSTSEALALLAAKGVIVIPAE